MTIKSFKISKHRFQCLALILLLEASTLMYGCSPGATPPISSTITVVTDPSLGEIKNKDPYAQISGHVLEAYKPDMDLYNTLFSAIDKMETTVDVSGFPLSIYEKVAACDSVYEQVGFQFYYVSRIKLSTDGNSVLITLMIV